jgi:UDP-glucose 4-epimerase
MKPNILLTGATGLVGSHILRALMQRKYNITVLSRKNKHENTDINWIQTDLMDFDASTLNDLKGIDVLVHNAGCIKTGLTKEDRDEIRKINFEATSKLFDWAQSTGIKKIIFTGSTSVIKKPLPELITEEADTNPSHYYGESKLFAENKLLALNENTDMANVILRISSPVPLSFEQLPQTVLKKWIDKSSAGGDIDVYGSGERTQDFISVRDIAAAFICSIEKESAYGVFNIASGTTISMIGLARLITNKFQNKINFTGIDANENDRWNISIEKAENILGFQPEFTSEENIKNLLTTVV